MVPRCGLIFREIFPKCDATFREIFPKCGATFREIFQKGFVIFRTTFPTPSLDAILPRRDFAMREANLTIDFPRPKPKRAADSRKPIFCAFFPITKAAFINSRLLRSLDANFPILEAVPDGLRTAGLRGPKTRPIWRKNRRSRSVGN